MTIKNRPIVSQTHDLSPIENFISELQIAIDTGDADLFNKQFASDVLWGSPFAAIANGYEQIHAIHCQMLASVVQVKGTYKFEIEHIRFLSENVSYAYVRKISQIQKNSNQETKPGSFDELALFILVKQNGQWWLAAAQHVPDRRDVYLKK
jgi:uncharacterized protein (TIGR02246 family)